MSNLITVHVQNELVKLLKPLFNQNTVGMLYTFKRMVVNYMHFI
jgi:hypothetical protein